MTERLSLAFDMFLVFIGGGLGSVFRWSVAKLSLLVTGTEFPWATLAVNLFGCFLVGLTVGTLDAGHFPQRLRPLLVAGFIGGLTTFSAYAYGLFEFGRRGRFGAALLQVGLENVLGIALAAGGVWLAAWLRR